MAPGSSGRWLSFSASPLEMLRTYEPQLWLGKRMMPYGAASRDSSHSSSSSQKRCFSNAGLHGNQWQNPGAPIPFKEGNAKESTPKMEDFLGSHFIPMTETIAEAAAAAAAPAEEPSLSSFYEHDMKTIVAAAPTTPVFKSFSANSGLEADDSASAMGSRPQGCSFSECSPESGRELALAAQAFEKTVEDAAAAAVANKKVADTSVQRTSVYRGVTRHRWTGRYEAHLWDNSCRREGQVRKGRQVYLGGYDKEEKAARAYDLAALKYWGMTATTNFPASDYIREIEEMKNTTKQEFIASLRRKSSGFSRGASIYRGVTRHHQQGRWQARIGRVAGNKDLYLGTFASEEEAAEAYDIAAIKFRGVNAVTNFEISRYDVDAISKSALPIGAAAKRLKQRSQTQTQAEQEHNHHHHLSLTAASTAAENPSSTHLLNSLFQFHNPLTEDSASCSFAYDGSMYHPYCLTSITTTATVDDSLHYSSSNNNTATTNAEQPMWTASMPTT